MKKEILEKELERKKIPKNTYNLNGGLPNEAFCLNSNQGLWEVYYSERGVKSSLKIFKTESEACDYLLQALLRNV